MTPKEKAIIYLNKKLKQLKKLIKESTYFRDYYFGEEDNPFFHIEKAIDIALKEQAKEIFEDIEKDVIMTKELKKLKQKYLQKE